MTCHCYIQARWKAVQTSCGTRVQGPQISVATIWLYSLFPRRQDSSKLLDSPSVQCQTAHLYHSLPVLYVKLPPSWGYFTGSIMLASPVCSDRSVYHFPVDLPTTPSRVSLCLLTVAVRGHIFGPNLRPNSKAFAQTPGEHWAGVFRKFMQVNSLREQERRV